MAELNIRGQASFSSVVVLLFAGAIYFLGLARFINDYMDEKVLAGSITGFEGFFLANFNFFVGFIYLIVLLVVARS